MELLEEDDIVRVVVVVGKETRVDIKMKPSEFKSLCVKLGYTFKKNSKDGYGFGSRLAMAHYVISTGVASFWSRE